MRLVKAWRVNESLGKGDIYLHALRLGCIDVDETGGTMVPCISSSVMASCVSSLGEAITTYTKILAPRKEQQAVTTESH